MARFSLYFVYSCMFMLMSTVLEEVEEDIGSPGTGVGGGGEPPQGAES